MAGSKNCRIARELVVMMLSYPVVAGASRAKILPKRSGLISALPASKVPILGRLPISVSIELSCRFFKV
ncbi:hypothetical protein SAMN05192529_11157 [Arachidicoccus rhizosphaerae]|uniref:Uncharacterized protein n=1 Tax=Arachidicoccus rhizosphaerae TaxID=551991 RepID=A0A1H3ZIV3_9BACT|nr:hypothetical protein [Arachidicoccus rhizosphaerae]SEA23699.1 hypothetical protein SAMN05192529_11157 [Arachidicoccus rhizosphaerae]